MIFQQKFLTSIWQRWRGSDFFKILITKWLLHTCNGKRNQNEIKYQLERESEERKGGKWGREVAKWESEERKGG